MYKYTCINMWVYIYMYANMLPDMIHSHVQAPEQSQSSLYHVHFSVQTSKPPIPRWCQHKGTCAYINTYTYIYIYTYIHIYIYM